jgi:hypothetical protein
MSKKILTSLFFFLQSFVLVANETNKDAVQKFYQSDYEFQYQVVYQFFFGDLDLPDTSSQNELYKKNIKTKEDFKVKRENPYVNEAYCKEYKDSITKKIDPQNYSAQTKELKKITQKLSNKIIIEILPATLDDGSSMDRNLAKDYFNIFYKSYFEFATGLYFMQLSKNYDVGAKIILENFKNLENMNSSNLRREIANSIITINEYSKKLIECNKLLGTEKLDDTSKKFFEQSAAYIFEANKSKNNIFNEAKLLTKKLLERTDPVNKNKKILLFDFDVIDLSIIEVSQNIPDLISTITDLNTLITSSAKANDIDIEKIKTIESLKNEL